MADSRPTDPTPRAIDPKRLTAVETTRRHVAGLAWVLDNAIPVPGTSRRFGLGPIVGLVPIVGDLVGAAAGVYLIFRAMQVGLPRVVITRMAVNVLIDTAVGVIPILGDAFDFVFKSNARNLRIFEQHALDPDRSTLGSWAFLGGLIIGALSVFLVFLWVVVQVVQAVLDLFRGAT